MQAFAQVCDAVAATPKRLEKVALIAAYLAQCQDDDLDAAARFFQGLLLPPREPQAALGGRTISDAAQRIFQLKSEALRTEYRRHGELGEALAALFAPPLDFGLLKQTLTPASLRERLRTAAKISGDQAALKRRTIVEGILGDCTAAREVAAVVKILGGVLRMGLREGLILDAIAAAFGRDITEVRRAAAAHADFGIIAVAAKHDSLREIAPAFGLPIAVMLANPLIIGSEMTELGSGSWIAEDKFDGIRAQLHFDGKTVAIFSRTGAVLEGSFPELVREVQQHFDEPVILDGEIIAARDGRPLPFRMLQPRLQRKDPSLALQAEIPIEYRVFDILAHREEILITQAWHERRERLESTLAGSASTHIMAAQVTALEGLVETAVRRLFTDARARGNEGLILKERSSAYTPGRRGGSWLKIKQELATLDVVVVGVEWGHGKRAKLLSDYTFSVRAADGRLVTIGKAYTGLTDTEIEHYTPWFQARFTGAMLTRRAYAVTPELVLEIAFDILAPSSLHESGYAMRFPRILRIRDDKSVADISTMDEVERIYTQMLEREAGSN